MPTRHTMTFFLVLTLLSNFAQHETGSVSASGTVKNEQFTTKKRILDRLFRQGLPSSERQKIHSHRTSQQHLYPARPLSEISSSVSKALRSSQHYALLQLIRSNTIPSREYWGDGENFSLVGVNNTSYIGAGVPNSYSSDLLNGLKSSSFPMGEDVEEYSSLHRRHTDTGDGAEQTSREMSAKERKRQRRLERQRRRQEKKDKRRKKKGRKRDDNNRLEQLLADNITVPHTIDGESYLECCPSKVEVFVRKIGKDRKNHAVQIRPSQKYFYQRVCLKDVVGKDCLFPSRSLRKGVKTRCVQQFAFTQAHVRPFNSTDDVEWQFDYIEVRSGCSCHVSLSPRRKKNKKRNK